MKKNVLVVTAHPSSAGFTHKIAEVYNKKAVDRGDKVTVLNLYNNPQEYLRYENQAEMKESDSEKERYQVLIKDADELVLVFPLWWGDCPAVLKNWWDTNMLSGFAFTYESGRPKGLLTGKTARVITTAGAPTFVYILNGILKSMKKIWKDSRFGFCGIKMSSFTLIGNFGSTSTRNEAQAIKKVTDLFN